MVNQNAIVGMFYRWWNSLTWISMMVYDLGDCKAQGAALKAIFYGYWKSLAPLQVMFTMCVQTDLLLCP
jgi:hypothetical protein